MSEDRVAEEQSESLKLVPVAESIRYRKRAQNAEKRAESLREELAEAQSQVSSMAEELSAIRREQELTRKLAGCGVVDLEAGVLLAGAKPHTRLQAVPVGGGQQGWSEEDIGGAGTCSGQEGGLREGRRAGCDDGQPCGLARVSAAAAELFVVGREDRDGR